MEGLGYELVVGQKNVLGFGVYARRCGECGATGRAGPGCSTKEAAMKVWTLDDLHSAANYGLLGFFGSQTHPDFAQKQQPFCILLAGDCIKKASGFSAATS